MFQLICLPLLAAASHQELVKLYDYDPKAPLELHEQGIEQRGGLAVRDISYASPKGGRVTAYLIVPPGAGPFAAVLFMHGGNGNRSSLLPGALNLARNGAVCLLIDSPLNGARAKPGERLADFTKPVQTRDAMIQTVIDLRRGVDLLLSRPDVDPKRLAYIGASYGGTIGGVLAAVERRIKAYALLVGMASASDFLRLSEHPNAVQTRQALSPDQLERNLQILSVIDPIQYIGHAAPAALLFQNGRQDKLTPEASALRYQQAGSEPKTIRWYDAGHSLNAEASRERMEWLRGQIGPAAP
jgi:cephalosporin-C deacetylase-like acetyl esterase